MARKRYTAEQIIDYLRQAEVMVGRGCTIKEVVIDEYTRECLLL